ncbi:N-acetylmuramoyl-L-alanine amidase [Streptomyces fradiae]
MSVYPYGTTRTSASNLNFVAGQTVPNMVVVPVKDGKITFYNHSGSVDLIADMAGYYTD